MHPISQHALAVSKALLAVVAFVAVAASARAASGEPAAHRSTPHAHHIVGLKLVGLETLAVGEPHPMSAEGAVRSEPAHHQFGGGVSFEEVVIPDWLDIEGAVLFSPGNHGLTLPAELLFKKPFEVNERVETYVGAGLGSEWVKEGHYEPRYGVASVVGSYFWLSSHFGLDLETEYSLLLTGEREHELVLALGGTARF